MSRRPTTNRQSKRYSVAALYMSMGGVDRDDDIDDALAKSQKLLRQLKTSISNQSKHNFVLEKDVRYLDSRIALLIQNKMGIEEQHEVATRLDDATGVVQSSGELYLERKKSELYGNLFFLLQSEPMIIALLCRQVSMGEIDSLLQTVMFTIYGNQYEQREEHLLLSMFQAVLASQFDAATEFSSLLRANTPVSRMMTTYTRRGPGQTYLRSCLSDVLNSIIEKKDLNLEIHPLKVYSELGLVTDDDESSITADEAFQDLRVQALVKPRLAQLDVLANAVLDTIITSLPTVPYGIRWICKQIRLLTRRKYPTASDTSVCSLIGAFFFLRFINPAIVTPQTYMLVDKHPGDKSRRVLTLVAKMLQNLANKPSYSKEPYMDNLASFVNSNRGKINTFLNDMCEVPDFYESLEMDQYVALSKKDLSLSITLNEIFTMHSLLVKYQDKVCPQEESHVAYLLRELGKPPGQVQRSKNGTIEIQLFNLWETEVGDVDNNNNVDLLRADMIFMEAKTLMINIIRAFPTGHSIMKRPLDLHRIADFAGSCGETGIVKRGIKALSLLEEIETSNPDDYDLLVSEVDYELNQLGSLRESVETEAASLQKVYDIIKEHNEYLKSQLETYRSYLHNVRNHRNQHKLIFKRYTPSQLARDNIIGKWSIPKSRLGNLFVSIVCPAPSTFVFSLIMKGRPEPIFVFDFKLDDLLEIKDKEIDMSCMVVNVRGLISLVNRDFKKK